MTDNKKESLYDTGYSHAVLWGDDIDINTAAPPNSWAATSEYKRGVLAGQQEYRKRKLQQLVLGGFIKITYKELVAYNKGKQYGMHGWGNSKQDGQKSYHSLQEQAAFDRGYAEGHEVQKKQVLINLVLGENNSS